MLRFRLWNIPVRVEWWFWLVVVLLGGGWRAQSDEDWIRVAVWAGVVFVSILVHELGHALTARRLGANPSILLHGMGGLTFFEGGRFTRRQSILVTAAGPAASLGLGFVIWILSEAIGGGTGLARVALFYGMLVNFFWTAVNLLPIPPLDGGQILRDMAGPRHRVTVTWVGCATAGLAALWAFDRGLIFLAVLLVFLAYQNFQSSRGQREGA